MDVQSKSKRVVMIHDASGGVRLKGVKWVLDGFLLKDGDMFTLLFVVHQIHHPMGYKIRVDSSMFGGANQKAIDDEVAKKKKDYENNLQLVEISKLYKMRKVEFKIELVAASIPKIAAVDMSKKCNATWVILDRRMKRDKKYFFEKLSCGISTMKHNEDIIDIRAPRRQHQTSAPYAEMLPFDNKILTGETSNDPDLFSIEFDTSCTSSTSTTTSFSFSDGILTIENNQDDKMSTLLEVYSEEDNSPGNQVTTSEETVIPMLDQKDFDNTEEVNGSMEINGQSQSFDEEVNYEFGGMSSPVPKQAKHFYQGAHL